MKKYLLPLILILLTLVAAFIENPVDYMSKEEQLAHEATQKKEGGVKWHYAENNQRQ